MDNAMRQRLRAIQEQKTDGKIKRVGHTIRDTKTSEMRREGLQQQDSADSEDSADNATYSNIATVRAEQQGQDMRHTSAG
jgi:hypothetical protein